MRSWFSSPLPLVLSGLLSVLAIFAFAPCAAASPRAAGDERSRLPLAQQMTSNYHNLSGIAVINSRDIWAVGDTSQLNTSDVFLADQPISEHWNGKAWQVIATPHLTGTGRFSRFNAVAAHGSRDVWAVGDTEVARSQRIISDQTLVEHWNGKSWQLVTSANVPNKSNILYGVIALATNNAWAVGSTSPLNSTDPSTAQTLIEHWNGKVWQRVSAPNGGALRSIAGTSAYDLWAVGLHAIEHWDGKHWTVTVSSTPDVLNAVASHSTKSAWAVGGSDSTLTEHWNGTAWARVPSPDVTGPSMTDNLAGVTTLSDTNVWAVGTSHFNDAGGFDSTLVLHWNGSTWTIISSPNTKQRFNDLRAVGAVSANDIWAVGAAYNYPGEASYPVLIEHWDGHSWTIFS